MGWLEQQREKQKREAQARKLTSEFAKGLDTPSGNPFGRWAQDVAQRTLHPLETLAGVARESMSNPTETALNWTNPMGASLSGLAGIFAGKGAKTANLANLEIAQKLKQQGVPDAEIWKQTGWTLDTPDRLPRFEIPDNAAMYRGSKAAGSSYAEDVMPHPELYQQYPSAGSIRIQEVPENIGGNYSDIGRETITLGNRDASSTALHELQHAIQQREGFARGGSPEQMPRVIQQIEQAQAVHQQSLPFRQWAAKQDRLINELDGDALDAALKQHAKDYPESGLPYVDPTVTPMQAYQRLAGEAEARLTQARMAMTPEQRLDQYPYQPEYFQQATGVPLSDLIVRQEGGNMASMNSELPYQITHKPMTIEGGASPLHDLTSSFGDDIYGKHALQYFGSGDPRELQTLRLMRQVKGNPNAQVTIYRGAPNEATGINAGDWVTLDKRVAQDYVDQALENEGRAGRVLSMKVPASHITSWPDSLLEFGYYPAK